MSIKVEKNPLNKIEKDERMTKTFEDGLGEVKKDVEASTIIKPDNIKNIIRLIMATTTAEDGERIFFENLPVILADKRVRELINSKMKEPEDDYYEETAYVSSLIAESIATRKSMIESSDYIEWLIDFAKREKKFYDDQWAYCPEKISSKDRENISKLSFFHSIICDYATKNEIPENFVPDGQSYSIKYKGTALEIGVKHGNGMVTFVSLEPEILLEDKDTIDFANVLIEEQTNNVREEVRKSIEEDKDPNNNEAVKKAVKKLKNTIKQNS